MPNAASLLNTNTVLTFSNNNTIILCLPYACVLPGMEAVSSEVSAVLAAQRARLRRAMERLAADLYSRQTHLLLELLQNADDCSYAAKVRPAHAALTCCKPGRHFTTLWF